MLNVNCVFCGVYYTWAWRRARWLLLPAHVICDYRKPRYNLDRCLPRTNSSGVDVGSTKRAAKRLSFACHSLTPTGNRPTSIVPESIITLCFRPHISSSLGHGRLTAVPLYTVVIVNEEIFFRCFCFAFSQEAMYLPNVSLSDLSLFLFFCGV